MAITKPYIFTIKQGITVGEPYVYEYEPEEGGERTGINLTGKVVVFRLKKAKLVNGDRRDFVIRSDADSEATADANGSTLIITDAAAGKFTLTITDEETATFEPIENIRWAFFLEHADGSKTPIFDGKARIIDIHG